MDVQIKLDPKDVEDLKQNPERIREGLRKGLRKSMYLVESESKKSFGQPGNLNVQSGRLRSSIQSRVKDHSDQYIGEVFSDVVYARIHEYGGTIKPRVANFLKFNVSGNWVITREVTMPARPFLGPSIARNEQKIEEIILESIDEEFED